MKQEPEMLNRARKLRAEMTPQERRLWYNFLRNYPVKFYKQKVIENYIVDFYCAPAKLVIEIDGSQHFTDHGINYDAERSAVLEARGLKIIRVTNTDINVRFSSVCEYIHNAVQERLA